MTDTKMFQFAHLQGFESGKPFDGMAPGKFTDMWGRPVVLLGSELGVYLDNTRQLLESTRDANGMIVGLPIDAMGHENREAAGWITDVQLSEDASVLRFTPRWNDIGQDLIQRDIMRFFSPSVDDINKVVIGGSLTNWPATRTAKQILLKPVELSMDIMQLDTTHEAGLFSRFVNWLTGQKPEVTQEEPMEDTTTPGVPETPVTLESPPVELAQPANLEAIIEERVNLRMAQKLAEAERTNSALSYATEASGKGLPVQAEELSGFLLSLSPDAEAKARAIFDKVLAVGVIDYAEKGHAKVKTGVTLLSAPIANTLRNYLRTPGASLELFFEINADSLGNQSDYDLSEFLKEEK